MSHNRFKIDARNSPLKPVVEVVAHAQDLFHRLLEQVEQRGGINQDIYIRYLSFQYHLTRNVQTAFLAVASHPSLADRRPLREFLFNFALEEEPHYSIAERDLRSLGATPLPCPLDVKLWWAYFTSVIPQRPFVRLGATCVLENLGGGGADVAKRLLLAAPFLRPDNTRFLQIHFHEALPHGDLIFHALAGVPLSDSEIADLRLGAAEGSVMYMRMASWALQSDPLQEAFDSFILDPQACHVVSKDLDEVPTELRAGVLLEKRE